MGQIELHSQNIQLFAPRARGLEGAGAARSREAAEAIAEPGRARRRRSRRGAHKTKSFTHRLREKPDKNYSQNAKSIPETNEPA